MICNACEPVTCIHSLDTQTVVLYIFEVIAIVAIDATKTPLENTASSLQTCRDL